MVRTGALEAGRSRRDHRDELGRAGSVSLQLQWRRAQHGRVGCSCKGAELTWASRGLADVFGPLPCGRNEFQTVESQRRSATKEMTCRWIRQGRIVSLVLLEGQPPRHMKGGV